jgi:hypothetical protein
MEWAQSTNELVEVSMGGRMGSKVKQYGTIGRQIFAQVEQLTAQGGMTRLAAFKRIAEASGRQVGTVAANYYRIARQKGAPLRSRKSRSAASGTSRISDVVQQVQRLLQQQADEIQRLWKEAAQFAKIRRLLRR